MFGNLTFDMAKPALKKLFAENNAKSLILSLDGDEFKNTFYKIDVAENIKEIKVRHESLNKEIETLKQSVSYFKAKHENLELILGSKKKPETKLKEIQKLLGDE